MKRPLVILLLGALAGATAFVCTSNLRSTAPSHPHSHTNPKPLASSTSHDHNHPAVDAHAPELAWLATEFHLTPQAFNQVLALHNQYKPRCEELCRRIEDHNRRLQSAILESRAASTEVLRLVEEGARVRSECHAALTRHLLEVAACMAPDQGRRYLELMLPATGITAASHPIGDFTHARPHE